MSLHSASDEEDEQTKAFSFEEAVEALASSLEETKLSKDYLSYSTILDVYLSNASQYSDSERDQLLSQILKDLKENPDITYEIAWDLPEILIPLVDSKDAMKHGIRDSPHIVTIIKIFECLTYNGNPKEVFLKACELLTSLNITEQADLGKEEDDFYRRAAVFNLKVHCVFELVSSSFYRIKTLYPSRFLSMAVAAMANLLGKNLIYTMITHFVVKRIYMFAREYQPLSRPEQESSDGLTLEEMDKIRGDEEILEHKLLTSLVTNTMHLSGVNSIFGFSYDLFSVLQSCSRQHREKIYNYSVESHVLDRLYELALSFDIDPKATFIDFIASSNDLFKKFDYKLQEDDLTGAIFENLVVDFQKNLSTTLIDSSATQVQDSLLGIIDLFTYKVCSSRKTDCFKISFHDASNLALRLMIPGMVNSRFSVVGIQDVAVFWLWYSLECCRKCEMLCSEEVSAVPTPLLRIIFQVLLHYSVTNKSRPDFTFIILTLLTKLLTLVDEALAYGFIKDSLNHCPYEDAKVDIVGILKLLLTNKHSACDSSAKTNSLDSLLAKVALDDAKEHAGLPDSRGTGGLGSGSGNGAKPALPPRGEPTRFFVELTEQRRNDLKDLICEVVSEAFPVVNGTTVLLPQKFSVLQAYLNLLYLVKPLLDTSFDDFADVVKDLETKIKAVQAKHESESDSMELNAVQMVQISVDRVLGM